MGDDRRELTLTQARLYQASALCTTCKTEFYAGPPLDGAEVSISKRLIEYALPPLQVVHSHSDACRDPNLICVVHELQAKRPARPSLPLVSVEPDGALCGSKGCTEPADVLVHWPGRRLPMCRVCADRALIVGARALGLDVSVSPLRALE